MKVVVALIAVSLGIGATIACIYSIYIGRWDIATWDLVYLCWVDLKSRIK